MNKFEKIIGATLALGVVAATDVPAKAERSHESVLAGLQVAETDAYGVWNNCTVRAHWGKKKGTIDDIYAGETGCKKEYEAFDTALMKRQYYEFPQSQRK